jgi:hypothetical protein
MRKFARYMLFGLFTPENIPNRKVRRTAILAAYTSAFYMLQVKYYQSKLEIMDREGLVRLSFTDWLRYQDLEGTADRVEQLSYKLFYNDAYPIVDTDGTRYADFSDEHPDFAHLT